ncbi:LacI family DNA-binding transcriptional regulator [Brachybacterium hainanense]|uniref:LacI family DNA-binding transcriptional regulator n=1 Tax=Brachybacterium hainanense TaxID=1541174 RepID=A0ABV6R5S0_9MICO
MTPLSDPRPSAGPRAAADRPPTIRDVAARAEVSIKSVSRVLNCENYVSDALRTRVQEAIDALAYRPNPAAQNLRSTSSGSIAMVVEDISEPFFSQLALAVEHTIAPGTIVIVSSTMGDPKREAETLQALAARQIDGIILAPTRAPRPRLLRALGRTAVVCVDRPVLGAQTDLVLSDNVGGMRRAVEHLLSQGHHRIAYLGDAPEVFTQRERLSGYRDALAARGITHDAALVYEHRPDPARIGRHLTWLRSTPDPPTAMVSGNSLTTLAMLRAGFDAGTDAFIAFDDFPLAEVVHGGVSVVAQDAEALGAQAAQTLERRIAHDSAPVRSTRIETRLTLRRGDPMPDGA